MINNISSEELNEVKANPVNAGLDFLRKWEVVDISIKSTNQVSFHHNIILDILWMYWDENKYDIDEVIDLLTQETSEDIRNTILWHEWISSKVSTSLFSVLQNFKNINISEYYHLILSLVSYVPKNGWEVIDDFNPKNLFNNFQIEWDFVFIQDILKVKYDELDFLMKWGQDLFNPDNKSENISINDSLDLKEIDNILREIREITAISWLIMQICSKNIWIVPNVIWFFDFLNDYHSHLSRWVGNMIQTISQESGIWREKLHNSRLLNLFELKLIELWNSHLLDYSHLNSADEIRKKYFKSLCVMDRSINAIDKSDYNEDKRFIFLKENTPVHKAKMFLQFCGEMDNKNIHYKYEWKYSLGEEEQFTLSKNEESEKILSEEYLAMSYVSLLEQRDIFVTFSTTIDVIKDLTKRINSWEIKLEKLMNIAFYLYRYGSLSDEEVCWNFSKALTERQFDKKSEYGMFLESIRISESIWRKNANLESTRVKMISINNQAEILEQERKDAYEKLEILANTDALTWLKNRWEFEKQLNLKCDYVVNRLKNTSWLIYIDLDWFKQVNDTLWHDAWDELLKKFADVLNDEFKRPGDIKARMWWDEFIIMIDWEKEDVEKMVKKVWWKIYTELNNLSWIKEGDNLELSVSMGITWILYWSWTDALIKQADKAMYQVKTDWKNWYMFSWEKSQCFE